MLRSGELGGEMQREQRLTRGGDGGSGFDDQRLTEIVRAKRSDFRERGDLRGARGEDFTNDGE